MRTSRATIWVFVLALIPGLALTASLQWAADRQARAEFDRIAELAVDRVVSRMRQHVVALRATRGLLESQFGAVTADEFRRFITSVDLVSELSGARGVGFAPMIAEGETAAINARIGKFYGVTVAPQPPTDQPWRTPVLLLEPIDEGTVRALGFDMYAEATRRQAMEIAIDSRDARMTGPVELVSGTPDENRAGFLIFLPLKGDVSGVSRDGAADGPPVAGFVYAAFRGQDLIEAALAAGPPLSVALNVFDTANGDVLLYRGEGAAKGLRRLIEVPVLGRQWAFDVRSTTPANFTVVGTEIAVFALLSVLFALAIASAVSARQKEAAQAREMAAAAARDAEYRDLLVQEMKHRIKNYITRIQSIARQSAVGATDVKAFSETFTARLRSMAAVQEILAGTVTPQAEVRRILARELQQAVDSDMVERMLDGPDIRLEERQAHAFAIVVHELTTNAMKYGGLSERGRGLKVSWTVGPSVSGQPSQMVLTWRERIEGAAAVPERTGSGFGSRLIDASLKGELSGQIDREFLPDGLSVVLSFPVAAEALARNPAPRSTKHPRQPG